MGYKVLAVDDERHILLWLSDLIREASLPVEVVLAESGVEALEEMNRCPADIAILDIRMPGFGGLELAEEIRRFWPEVRLIFLTGYDEFDAIYRANKLENAQYLLKLEDEEAIARAIGGAIESIHASRHTRRMLDRTAHCEEVLRQLEECDAYAGALRGIGLAPQGAPKRFELMCVVLSWTETPTSMGRCERVLRIVDASSALPCGGARWVESEPDLFFCILPAEHAGWVDMAPMREFCLRVAALLSCDVFLVKWREPLGWPDAPRVASALASFARRSVREFGARTEAVCMGEMDERSLLAQSRARLNRDAALKKLADVEAALAQSNADALSTHMRTLANMLSEADAGTPAPEAMEIYHRLSGMLLGYVNLYGMQEALPELSALRAAPPTRSAAFDALARLGEALIHLSLRDQQDAGSRLVQRIEQYVRDHLGDELSLTLLSDYVNYTPVYVSRTFKRASGVNLFDYITNQRMDRAKELLTQTDMKIYDISRQVGMSSPNYFAMLFRKRMGMTPQEYRLRRG